MTWTAKSRGHIRRLLFEFLYVLVAKTRNLRDQRPCMQKKIWNALDLINGMMASDTLILLTDGNSSVFTGLMLQTLQRNIVFIPSRLKLLAFARTQVWFACLEFQRVDWFGRVFPAGDTKVGGTSAHARVISIHLDIVSANLFDGDLPCLQATLRWCAYMRASSLNSSNLHGYSMHMSLAWRAAQNFVEPMLLHLTCKYAWCVCIYIFWNNLVYAHCACDWIARLLGLLPGFVMPYARIFKCAGRRFASIFQWACAPDKFLCDFDCLPYRMLAFRSVISWPSH